MEDHTKEPPSDNLTTIPSATNSRTQETQDNNVTNPPKPEKKRIKEYLLEGLMIFIAVSLGFIADNIREYYTNKQIEQRSMELVVDNLREDLEDIQWNINYTEGKVKILDTLISFRDDIDSLYSKRFSYLVTKSIYNPTYFSNTASIDQMKSSGSLQLIKNKEILSGIFMYQGRNERLATARERINDDDDRWVENASTFLDMQNLADSRGLEFFENSRSESQVHLKNHQQNIFKFFNQAIMRKSILEIIWLPQMRRQQENAEALIELLEKEYLIKG